MAPKGSGATGLWRPEQDGASQIFILQQDGNTLTGTAEGVSGDWAGGVDAAAPILDGKVDGSSVSFKVGNATYAGTMKGDHIELVRAPVPGPQRPKAEEKTAELRPAIGPAPDGSDPSRSPFSRPPGPVPVVLHRVQR
jgi:beta-galactosidase